MADTFRHLDHAAAIVFGRGAVDRAADLIGSGYTLLTTERAAMLAPSVMASAGRTVLVPSGQVDVVAAAVRAEAAGASRLVALGGGRVIDVAKAVAAADGLPGPVAIPTSLSGAEMTGVHRHARGVTESTPRVRASVVVNDPALSGSQPVAGLAASTANALGHAATALVSERSTALARPVARDAIERLVRGWQAAQLDRDEIALGALLAGWAVDRSGLGPHHALAQTAVRLGDLAHGPTNAALLPGTIAAYRRRDPAPFESLDRSLGVALESFAADLRVQAGDAGLGRLFTDQGVLTAAVETAAARPELSRVPPALEAGEIRELYEAAAERV